jgi:hypothetical protein
MRLFLVPLAGDNLNRVGCSDFSGLTLLLPKENGVSALLEQALCIIAVLARVCESDLRINAKREQLLLASDAIFQTPVFRTIGFDQQIKPASVAQLVLLIATLCVPNCSIGERH